ncbi:hypothetical protein QWZ10_19905 [Paracoccus cavernae]|uniref:Uncharacterized protein n=1 Tax=Paracoccus cavernae TaxID=1571207 RepID=A0ABT8D9H2_9RHOB|nr:hypothetical protein [Paracoccus cavernae]
MGYFNRLGAALLGQGGVKAAVSDSPPSYELTDPRIVELMTALGRIESGHRSRSPAPCATRPSFAVSA